MCKFSEAFKTIISKEDFKTILFTVLFQMVLPFTDSGTDIRLGIRLFMNGHPKWALSVLMPVFISTFFTAIACREIEKRANKRYWIVFLPLVIFQLYPQFCICRLLFQYYKGKISLEQFISARDSMDGGLGCVEPYCESVPQVFIQTTIFALTHNMDQLVNRLCYTETDKSCKHIEDKYRCDKLYDCHTDRYSYGYGRYESFMNNPDCFAKFDNCAKTFMECIDHCKTQLNGIIANQTETELYTFVSNSISMNRSTLVQNYAATDDDLKMIQLHKIVIENYGMFAFTFIISILSASYGISKFFRLGHSHIVCSLLSRKFAAVCFVTTVYFILKGVTLLSIVQGACHTKIYESVLWWFLFTMAPTSVLVFSFSVIQSCIKLQKKFGKFRLNIFLCILAVGDMILKQPCIVLSPHITPFFFTLGDIKIYDMVPINLENNKYMKSLSCIGTYSYSPTLTKLNAIISIIFAVSVICWKGVWVRGNVVNIIFSIFVSILLFYLGRFLLDYVEKKSARKFGENEECIKHNKRVCLECIEKYGIYVERYKYFEACEEHDFKKPYDYQYQTKNCAKCKNIKFRLVYFLNII